MISFAELGRRFLARQFIRRCVKRRLGSYADERRDAPHLDTRYQLSR